MNPQFQLSSSEQPKDHVSQFKDQFGAKSSVESPPPSTSTLTPGNGSSNSFSYPDTSDTLLDEDGNEVGQHMEIKESLLLHCKVHDLHASYT